jgi:hypothetical protein
VQLAWTNTRNVANSLVIPSSAGTSVPFGVPPGKYGQLQIYVTSGAASSTLTVTLTYAAGSPAISTLTIPDWCQPGILPAGEYKLASAQRIRDSTTLDTQVCNIYAVDLNPDPMRVLQSVAFVANGTGFVVFYGATAW